MMVFFVGMDTGSLVSIPSHPLKDSIALPLEESNVSFNADGFSIVILFSLLLILVCLWSCRKGRMKTVDAYGLANRSLNGIEASMTMTSLWLGGGYLFCSGESVVSSDRGLLWTQGPWTYFISFILTAYLFSDNFRSKGYLTLFDAFAETLGSWMAAFLYIPSLIGDLVWIAVSLSTLGHAFSILIGLDPSWSILLIVVVSLTIALTRGMLAIKYTGVIEMIVMGICLLIALFYICTSQYVGPLANSTDNWLGSIASTTWSDWIDQALMFCLGGTSHQVYYQVVLSSKTVETAFAMSVYSGAGVLLCGIIACFIAICASTVDWATFDEIGSIHGNERDVLSIALKYLIPEPVSVLSILGITAAILSSVTGMIFSSAAAFSVNMYKAVIRPQARDPEVIGIWRLFMVLIGVICFLLALSMENPYSYWICVVDFTYVLIFPQLFLCVYCSEYINTYGSIVMFLAGIILRLGAGEELLSVPSFIPYPYWLPFRTVSVVGSVCLGLLLSYLSKYLIVTKNLVVLDIFHIYHPSSFVSRGSKRVSIFGKRLRGV
ncbi:hypothetical protein WA171_005963 [Blastocystis sp. BT1]